MTLRFYYNLIFFTLLFFGCNPGDREQNLVDREADLEQREQRVRLLEEEYLSLLKMRDSLDAIALATTDTSTENNSDWPDGVHGDWNSRMVCRASRCANYVIGDQRNELWRFYSDSTGSYVQVVNNDQQIRVFEGKYDGQKIMLHVSNDSNTTINVARRVQLDDIAQNVMKGNLILTGQNNCEAVFSVELTPRAN